jgi:hypothetical protein
MIWSITNNDYWVVAMRLVIKNMNISIIELTWYKWPKATKKEFVFSTTTMTFDFCLKFIRKIVINLLRMILWNF